MADDVLRECGLSQPAVTRQLGVLEAGDWLRTAASAGFAIEREALGVQMTGPAIAPALEESADLPGLGALGDADAAEMLALAQLTEPGPFLPGAHRMGRSLGLRVDGRLVAMAGERLRPAGRLDRDQRCLLPSGLPRSRLGSAPVGCRAGVDPGAR